MIGAVTCPVHRTPCFRMRFGSDTRLSTRESPHLRIEIYREVGLAAIEEDGARTIGTCGSTFGERWPTWGHRGRGILTAATQV